MLFTRGSDYALRGLVHLATRPKGELVMASEIAAAEGMPAYFFSKVFQSLAKSGLVNSSRGSKGGFTLAKPPEEITLRHVIESLEGPITISTCVNAPDICERSETCPFRGYWSEAQESLVSTLDKHTLADAVARMQGQPDQRAGSSDILH